MKSLSPRLLTGYIIVQQFIKACVFFFSPHVCRSKYFFSFTRTNQIQNGSIVNWNNNSHTFILSMNSICIYISYNELNFLHFFLYFYICRKHVADATLMVLRTLNSPYLYFRNLICNIASNYIIVGCKSDYFGSVAWCSSLWCLTIDHLM